MDGKNERSILPPMENESSEVDSFLRTVEEDVAARVEDTRIRTVKLGETAVPKPTPDYAVETFRQILDRK